MERISWFRRLFWGWEKLRDHFYDYFQTSHEQQQEQQLATTLQMQEQFEQKVESINEKRFSELKAINEKRFSELQTTNNDLRDTNYNLKKQISRLEQELDREKETIKAARQQFDTQKNKTENLSNLFAEAKTQILEKQRANAELKKEISDKLNPLFKIERTFFNKAGSKGIGELGELQLKVLLEKSGLNEEFWTENLKVATKNVEFAIKSGKEGKWIPIDSKVITPELDDDNKAIIDKQYFAKIKGQAREMTKYLGKHNTEGYGVLVLQSDAIYMSVYEQDSSLFRDIVNEYKIYIASPSSFIQMAWSISQIVDIYEIVKSDAKIHDEMLKVLNNIANFAKSIRSAQKSLNIALDSHFPAIENKHNHLRKQLDRAGKLKAIEQLSATKK